MVKIKQSTAVILFLSVLVIILSVLLILPRRQKPQKVLPPAPPLAIKGKIAIVIDDWGYRTTNLSILKEIKYPLTCAVLPHLSYSKLLGEELPKMGHQVILHLPMEPHENYRLEKNTIRTSMSKDTIKKIVSRDLENLPQAVGVSNHMGSKATEDARTMAIVFEELKTRGLFFLDSFVSPKTICSSEARKISLPFAKRDIFLDNEEDPAYIRGQLKRLRIKASTNGQAIGIGHDQRVTLGVLKEEMPKLAKEGYEFVLVSELVN